VRESCTVLVDGSAGKRAKHTALKLNPDRTSTRAHCTIVCKDYSVGELRRMRTNSPGTFRGTVLARLQRSALRTHLRSPQRTHRRVAVAEKTLSALRGGRTERRRAVAALIARDHIQIEKV